MSLRCIGVSALALAMAFNVSELQAGKKGQGADKQEIKSNTGAPKNPSRQERRHQKRLEEKGTKGLPNPKLKAALDSNDKRHTAIEEAKKYIQNEYLPLPLIDLEDVRGFRSYAAALLEPYVSLLEKEDLQTLRKSIPQIVDQTEERFAKVEAYLKQDSSNASDPNITSKASQLFTAANRKTPPREIELTRKIPHGEAEETRIETKPISELSEVESRDVLRKLIRTYYISILMEKYIEKLPPIKPFPEQVFEILKGKSTFSYIYSYLSLLTHGDLENKKYVKELSQKISLNQTPYAFPYKVFMTELPEPLSDASVPLDPENDSKETQLYLFLVDRLTDWAAQTEGLHRPVPPTEKKSADSIAAYFLESASISNESFNSLVKEPLVKKAKDLEILLEEEDLDNYLKAGIELTAKRAVFHRSFVNYIESIHPSIVDRLDGANIQWPVSLLKGNILANVFPGEFRIGHALTTAKIREVDSQMKEFEGLYNQVKAGETLPINLLRKYFSAQQELNDLLELEKNSWTDNNAINDPTHIDINGLIIEPSKLSQEHVEKTYNSLMQCYEKILKLKASYRASKVYNLSSVQDIISRMFGSEGGAYYNSLPQRESQSLLLEISYFLILAAEGDFKMPNQVLMPYYEQETFQERLRYLISMTNRYEDEIKCALDKPETAQKQWGAFRVYSANTLDQIVQLNKADHFFRYALRYYGASQQFLEAQEILKVDQTIRLLSGSIMNQSSEANNLKDSVKTTLNSLDLTTAELQQTKKELQRLNKTVTELEGDLNKKKGQLEANIKRENELKKESNEARRKLKVLESELENTRSDLESAKAAAQNVKILEDEILILKADLPNKESALEKLKSSIEAQQKQIKSDENTKKQLEKSISEQKSIILNLESQVSQLETQMNDLKTQHAEKLTKMESEHKGLLTTAQDKINELQTSISNLEAQLKEKEAELQKKSNLVSFAPKGAGGSLEDLTAKLLNAKTDEDRAKIAAELYATGKRDLLKEISGNWYPLEKVEGGIVNYLKSKPISPEEYADLIDQYEALVNQYNSLRDQLNQVRQDHEILRWKIWSSLQE